MVAEHEVQLSSCRLEVVELRGMLRRVMSEGTYSDVFTTMEQHTRRAEHEAQWLR
jgi:hypothetical protein